MVCSVTAGKSYSTWSALMILLRIHYSNSYGYYIFLEDSNFSHPCYLADVSAKIE